MSVNGPKGACTLRTAFNASSEEKWLEPDIVCDLLQRRLGMTGPTSFRNMEASGVRHRGQNMPTSPPIEVLIQ
jgi:hypothetical protein